MIKNTFTILPKISYTKERNLWSIGIEDWYSFLKENKIKNISEKAKIMYNKQLERASFELEERNSKYFSNLLKPADVWRLYPEFKDEALFLDIETSIYYGDVTVIGMYNGEDFYTMLQGKNMDKELFKKILANHKLLLTFNGSSFDIPVLERFFKIKIDIPHLDLRHLCSRIGLKGGLKSIEKQIFIKRDEDVSGLEGKEAVMLWENFLLTKEWRYLNRLLKYNEEDVVNLKKIADFAVKQMENNIKNINFKELSNS